LQQEVGAGEGRARVVEQAMQQIGGCAERNVGDDPERFGWKRYAKRVALDDLDVRVRVHLCAERGRPSRIDLDCAHARRSACQLGGQHAAARPDLDHEVARLDVRLGDEPGGERPASEEVLAVDAAMPAAPWLAAPGHGGTPRSYSCRDLRGRQLQVT
jgi:hypothetical protein